MGYNKINLFLSAVLVIILYFILPKNNAWLYDKVIENGSITYQFQHMDAEERRIYRYGYSYSAYQVISERLTGLSNAVILFPPQIFVERMHLADFQVPEPSVFYYFTGMRCVWANSPDADQANYTIGSNEKGNLMLLRIKSKESRDSFIAQYKPYLK